MKCKREGCRAEAVEPPEVFALYPLVAHAAEEDRHPFHWCRAHIDEYRRLERNHPMLAKKATAGLGGPPPTRARRCACPRPERGSFGVCRRCGGECG